MIEPLKDPDGNVYPDEVQALVSLLQIDEQTYAGDALVRALESVRSMEHGPNVVWLNSRGDAAAGLRALLREAHMNHHWFRVTVDQGALKIKVGEHSWSPPIYAEEKEA